MGAESGSVLVHNIGLADPFETTRRDTLLLAPFSGAGDTLAGCASRLAIAPDAISSDALHAAYAPGACSTPDGQRVILRTHANGVETDFPIDPSHRVSHLRVSGRYLAYTDYAPAQNSGLLRLFDIESRAELTQITQVGSEFGAFALQDDGAVAVCRGSQIVEYPIGQPARTLPGSECDAPLAAAAVGYLTLLDSGASGEVSLAAYSAGRMRTVARLIGSLEEQGSADTNDKLAVFRRRYCAGWEVATSTIGGRPARAESRCKADLYGKTRRSKARTRLLSRLKCPDGCVATVKVRRVGVKKGARSRTFTVRREARRRVTIRLPKVLRSGRLAVSVATLQPPFRRTRVTDRASVSG